MDRKTVKSLARKLGLMRDAIFKEVADAEADLRIIAEDRESELEERAQAERAARLLARLDDRGKREIEEIDEALRRISAGTYGICESCGGRIDLGRLRAVPAVRVCIECAREEAREAQTMGEPEVEAPVHHPGRLPDDAELLGDRELEQSLLEQIRSDGRVDMDELRVVCRHGIVNLDGTLPSRAEHQILLGLIKDVAGIEEVVDRLQIQELLWERGDRPGFEPPSEERPQGYEPEVGTEDVVKAVEEGLSYVPPGGPVPEEE
jgi:DnaK suppressor protein